MASRYNKLYNKTVHPDFDKGIVGLSTIYESIQPSGSEYVIPPYLNYRPDLIAYAFYGDAKLAWVLIAANRIEKSPEGFVKGTTIIVPPLDSIREFL
jgi:hypothetical protein